jgi:uncharacterized membrane protein (DUF373 family)
MPSTCYKLVLGIDCLFIVIIFLTQEDVYLCMNMNWKDWLTKDMIVRNLEGFQNFIVVSLCVGLFCVMLLQLWEMYSSLLKPLNFKLIASDILFILILVELFRLLIFYIKEQRISVETAVEVSLVSALREVILQGVLGVKTQQLLGICAFLTVLGGLLLLRNLAFQSLHESDSVDVQQQSSKM